MHDAQLAAIESEGAIVDREALLRAVRHPQFKTILDAVAVMDFIDDAQYRKWRELCLIRAAMRELQLMADELGDVKPTVRADDPYNVIPVGKTKLWEIAHPGEEPANTAIASRWFVAEILKPCDATPRKASSRKRVTLNLRLFAERVGLSLDHVCDSLP